MSDEKKRGRLAITVTTPWVTGWLFTIGFAKLTFWQGVLATVLWPYYIGTVIR